MVQLAQSFPAQRYFALRFLAENGGLQTSKDAVLAEARHDLLAVVLARQAKTGEARRTMPRAPLAIAITLHLDEWETDTVTSDLSAGGCALRLYNAPPSQFRFTLRLGDDVRVRGWARVVASGYRDDLHLACISFVGLTGSDRQKVEDLVLEACAC